MGRSASARAARSQHRVVHHCLALFAHCSAIDRTAPSLTPWNIVAVFTLIWIGAGMVSGPKQVVELFEQLATAP
jgi:hypothetical protein